MRVVVAVGKMKTIARIGDSIFGISAIAVIAGKHRRIAQVLPAGKAIAAVPASAAEPRHADPLAHADTSGACTEPDDGSHDFMPQYQRRLVRRKIGIHDVQVCPAYAASSYPDQKIVLAWRRNRHARGPQRQIRPLQQHCRHGAVRNLI